MIKPIFVTTDVGLRIAARHGLDFYIESEYSLVERGEYGTEEYGTEERVPTYPELQMWYKIVPEEERYILSDLCLQTEPPTIEAIPEEIYSALIYKEAVYLSFLDLDIARRLKDFNLNSLDIINVNHQVGYFKNKTAIFLSRKIPQGFYYPCEGKVLELHTGLLSFELKSTISADLRMFRVEHSLLPKESVVKGPGCD